MLHASKISNTCAASTRHVMVGCLFRRARAHSPAAFACLAVSERDLTVSERDFNRLVFMHHMCYRLSCPLLHDFIAMASSSCCVNRHHDASRLSDCLQVLVVFAMELQHMFYRRDLNYTIGVVFY